METILFHYIFCEKVEHFSFKLPIIFFGQIYNLKSETDSKK